MSIDHEDSGDYSYDLAHEIRTAVALPSSGARNRPVTGSVLGRELDPGGDLGYDLVHEL